MIRKFKHRLSIAIASNEGCLKGLYTIKLGAGCNPYIVDAILIENTTDWQEILEPKYQILSFQHPENGNIYKLNPDGTYGYSYNCLPSPSRWIVNGLSITYEKCLKRYPIHSVKRLSDDVVFNTKSIVRLKSHKDFVFPINKFVVFGKEILTEIFYSIENIELAPEPPLTATLTITYSDKRPKETYKLNKGEQALIWF